MFSLKKGKAQPLSIDTHSHFIASASMKIPTCCLWSLCYYKLEGINYIMNYKMPLHSPIFILNNLPYWQKNVTKQKKSVLHLHHHLLKRKMLMNVRASGGSQRFFLRLLDVPRVSYVAPTGQLISYPHVSSSFSTRDRGSIFGSTPAPHGAPADAPP
jgi:hypothetical protein